LAAVPEIRQHPVLNCFIDPEPCPELADSFMEIKVWRHANTHFLAIPISHVRSSTDAVASSTQHIVV